MKQTYKLIFIALLLIGLCVSGVQAAPVNFTAWTQYGDLWESHNGTYTNIMANTTGTHTWLATNNATSVNYLVVAGGGAGGGSGALGGGGGAGGFRTGTNLSVSGSVTVIVGSGGTAVTNSRGNSGGNSTFSTIESAGGGGGGAGDTLSNGNPGGSGGGGVGYYSGGGGSGNIPTVSPSQGNNGGNGGPSPQYGGAGGGGAGGGGGSTSTNTGGGGGNGLTSDISGVNTYYAGGGGGASMGLTGGTGGTGGGGNGANHNTVPSTAGTNNLGGGGGGGVAGANGGSGVVIIQYLTPTILTVSFSATPMTGVNPLTVSFNDTTTSKTAITSYNISFGNGEWWNDTAFPAANITHLYSTAGNYTVDWYVTNAEGTGSASTTITAWGAVHSAFSLFNAAGTAPHTTYLYDQSTNLTPGPVTYLTDFGDGNTSTEANTYYTWNTTGEYNVTHTVSNGLSSETSFMNVTVGTPTPAVIAPVASFYGSPTTGNVPLTVSFTDVSSNTPTSWNWSFGDGLYSELQNPSHTYTRSGFRTVNLTATNSAGSNVTVRLKFVRVS